MDSDALRQEITVQVQEEFEAQLREIRRRKDRAEEELETSSERWRSERRRLNAEIEHLEDALAEASKSSGADPVSVAPDPREIQQAVDEQLRKASVEWDLERERLKAQVARLEAAHVDALTRLSNPLRATQTLKEQFDVKLADTNRLHLEAEREFFRGRAAWEDEKKKLLGDLIRLRRQLPPAALQVKEPTDRLNVRGESLEQVRIRELEGLLSEARDATLRNHETLIRSANDLANVKRESQELNRALTEMRDHVGSGTIDQLRHEYTLKIQDLIQQNEQLTQKLDGAGAGGSSTLFKFSDGSSNGAGDGGPIDAEIARVESAMAAFDRLIDDPDTLASTIAQKNVEKTEMEAYLRGLRFQAARTKGV